MKKSLLTIGLVFGAVCALTAIGFKVGNGNVIDEHREMKDFSGISASGAATVLISKGKDYSCVVSLDSNLQSAFQTKVTRGVLVMGFKPGTNVNRFKKLEIRLTMPEVRKISASGASRIELDKGFAGKELSLDLSGASKISAAASYQILGVELSGASKADLSGKYGEIAVNISGASHFTGSGSALGLSGLVSGASRIDFSECALEDADMDASGASHVRLSDVSKKIKARLSGASDLQYEGEPEVEKNCSGGSSVKKL